jgi:steroid 5-alpha reductase family enzyme
MNSYYQLALILFVYMTMWFITSLVKKRNDVADVAWGCGFILLAWSSFFISGNEHIRSIIVNSLITIWGLRLSYHIFKRNRFKAEDYRYQEWRKQWGKWFILRSYAQVYLLQGLFLFSIVFPTLYINKNSSSALTVVDGIGLLVWILGFIFESTADRQLAAFIGNPVNKGKIMQSGLWSYSRHPNYFGEVTQWWGIYIYALSVAGGWMTIFGPLTITVLILFVSGVPLLEKKYKGRADFEVYKKRTSIFFPLPPKK